MNNKIQMSDILSPREVKALKRAGIETIEQLTTDFPHNVQQVKGCGLKSIKRIQIALNLKDIEKLKTKTFNKRMDVCARSSALSSFLRKLSSQNYDSLE
ncbi:DNA-directed RNA polymerase subunit alpha C-terminal domain-containing protein [Comamonas sp.]|uniref:DNA-directed RNA polymerase subunit alpha C-terminal domain-containing protein n=1 Tax=Comamonas sp. TaxID=34028 RepID=UPI0028AE6E3D|nr:DNA-directed RNA polymerase subunit alpha C-terminal domain-containing protein [Comamonas sp.]